MIGNLVVAILNAFPCFQVSGEKNHSNIFRYLLSLLAREEVVLWAWATRENEKAQVVEHKTNADVHKRKKGFLSS